MMQTPIGQKARDGAATRSRQSDPKLTHRTKGNIEPAHLTHRSMSAKRCHGRTTSDPLREVDRKQAASFLGVSLRTLDRLAASGRLTKGTAHRKTRPCVVFKDDELHDLKVELDSGHPVWQALPRSPDEPKDTIAFRIDVHYMRVLKSKGQVLGMSPGEFARSLVIRSLEEDQAHLCRHEVRRMREALGATFYALLTMKLGTAPAEARRIVNDTILKD